ncbi:MAG: hypothetical protein LBO04_02660 [Spirochaetaceae bacterium]|jgi:hypothetical protein|nr:hypothetical protein [Spirochaetaceae bacterium]
MKKKSVALFVALVIAGGGGVCNFAQTDKKFEEGTPSIQDKLKFELEFNASILSANSDGDVDSMTDAGFNEDETKIGISYEGELWGASAALKFGNENIRFFSPGSEEMFPSDALTLDELYGWIKPFGEHFKFTGGVFDNTDGLADYTDDIDDFEMGAFMPPEDEGFFSEPGTAIGNNYSLANGLMTDLIFGPLTLQLNLSPNYSGKSASDLFNGFIAYFDPSGASGAVVDTNQRYFRVGGRLIFDAGVGNFSALFKTYQWPTNAEQNLEIAFGMPPTTRPGPKENYHTFGAYFDLTAIENLGLSLGYTGFLPVLDADDVDNVLYSGIDLRLTWTGIEGLSLSTHNNISFAKGSEKDWFILRGDDASFFSLYNAVGATKEITERFSVNAEIMNILTKYDFGDPGELGHDNFAVTTKFIAKVGENAEFNVGLSLDILNSIKKGQFAGGGDDIDDTVTTFSIPVGIIISF